MLNVIPANGKSPFLIGPFAVTTNKAGPVTWYDLQEKARSARFPGRTRCATNCKLLFHWKLVICPREILKQGTDGRKIRKGGHHAVQPGWNDYRRYFYIYKSKHHSRWRVCALHGLSEYWPNFDHFTVQVQGQ